jgi:poly(3-hydroxybutyrate) depolymerase
MKRTGCFLMICLALLSCCKPDKTDFKPMYKEPLYDVAVEQGRVYAKNVKGHWSTYPDTGGDFGDIYINKVKDLAFSKDLDLDMDIYYPKEPVTQSRRPLLLLIHGGAFYNGDKQDIGYPEMGHHFAERGYVVASINYRLGFKPLAPDVDRAGYRAVQDAHAAVCYLMENADEFGIDTTRIFAAGTSAGAITALNLAFMQEENRPESTRKDGVKGWVSTATETLVGWLGRGLHALGSLFNRDWGINGEDFCETLGLDSDLGPINAVSGTSDRPFKIKAVVNMWGAVHDLSMLKNAPETSILSFHGDADRIVPYDYGYPFDQVLDPYVDDVIYSLPGNMMGLAEWMRNWVTSGRPINEWAFNPMHGSKAIHDKASSMGMHSELHTVEGGGHSLHLGEYRDELSDYYEDIILPEMTRFLCEEMAGGPLVQIVEESDGWFRATGMDNVAELHWVVEGGKITRKDGGDRVKVKFYDDVPLHSVTACGRYRNGVEFREALMKN